MSVHLHPARIRYTLFVVAVVAVTVILFRLAPLVWSVLQIFIVSALFTLALNSAVRWQTAYGIPRWAATANIMVLFLVLLAALVTLLIPTFISQVQQFIVAVPVYFATLTSQVQALAQRFPWLGGAAGLQDLAVEFFRGTRSWVTAAGTIFTTAIGAVTAIFLSLIITFYSLLNPQPLVYGVRGLFPSPWYPTLDRIATAVAERVRSWVVGTLILSAVIGILDYTALTIINLFFEPNIPFVFFFAILGAMLEVIPVVGPLVATVLPALVGFSISPALGFWVIVAFFIIQQLENNLLVPLIMHRALHMHPVSLIFALVVLTGLFGIFGGFIAVPTAIVVKVVYDEWYYPLLHGDRHPDPPPTEETEAEQEPA